MKKLFKISLLLLFYFLFSSVATAQSEVSDKQIIKYLKAKKLEWIAGENNLAKVYMKSTKKWGVYEINAYNDFEEVAIHFEEIVPAKFDSIGWFKNMQPFTIVKNKKKYGILINPYEIHDASEKVQCKYDAITIKEADERYYALVKEENLWGLVDWFEGIYLVDPSFENPEDVPLLWVESWAIDTFKASKKKLKADILTFDAGNGDGVFKARIKKTKKWGMYQSLDSEKLTTLVPANYDSIAFFPFNGKYTAVYKNEKVGFYLSYWSYGEKAKQSVPCIYEDYKRYEAAGIPKLAVKKNEKWGWVDWLTGEEKSEFKYDKPNDLPYPYYKQETWIEE
ncbi:hypothetical protein KO494_13330 [Lacinutrix sp. C3R15]|uniref:WG repeat-containing protein n=1 Tax=Flavobacteriaceae TaxID=49546 RepID=UPI001C09297A|nr:MULTISPECIES: WG repeat-containing protein [Flavobacteriaceae]MBU2940524.1 hypothetical protein [Lacinutrix sp. C3R15]MDO6623844.1 WG repeat-containing protein [Oceanihabitans sp. 1_MG-2023]